MSPSESQPKPSPHLVAMTRWVFLPVFLCGVGALLAHFLHPSPTPAVYAYPICCLAVGLLSAIRRPAPYTPRGFYCYVRDVLSYGAMLGIFIAISSFTARCFLLLNPSLRQDPVGLASLVGAVVGIWSLAWVLGEKYAKPFIRGYEYEDEPRRR